MADFAGLETILDRIHAALMAGDLPALAELSVGAEGVLMTTGNCDRALAARLAQKARRNERLLAAAVKGVKAARRRALDLTDAGRFSTYGAGGQRDQHGLPLHSAARRL